MSIAQTHSIAKEILTNLRRNRSGTRATVVACSGNLGSGKTSFVKGIAKALGIKERVTSPTFVIERIYKIGGVAKKRFGFSHLVHIDAYRLDDWRELAAIGFDKLIRDKGNLIIIEWGEKMKRILPKHCRHLHFKFIDEKIRSIKLKK